jgi:hypothetical protein
MPATTLTTSKQDLFNCQSDADGGNATDRTIGRVTAYFIFNVGAPGSASTDRVEVFINNQTVSRNIPIGQNMTFRADGGIYRVQAKLPDASALAAVVDHGVQYQ